jgi:DNA-binding NarL/FixJ family response regulator
MIKFPVQILLADDQAACIKAMSLVIDAVPYLELCGAACNGSELIIKTGRLNPDVVITDIKMPVLDGIAATQTIKTLYPQTKVIALTQFGADQFLIKMMKAGADGFILKDAIAATFESAIKAVMNDIPFFCTHTIKNLPQILRHAITFNKVQQLPPDFFAPNEREILQLLCKGRTSKEIATALRLSYFTVIKYRQNLLEKTDTHNVAELILFALRYGLYED